MKSILEALKINSKTASDAHFGNESETLAVLEEIVDDIVEKASYKDKKNAYNLDKMLSPYITIPGMDMTKIKVDDFKRIHRVDERFIKDDGSYRFYIGIGNNVRYFGKRFDGFLIDITNGTCRGNNGAKMVLYGSGTKDLSPSQKADRLDDTVVWAYTKVM